MPDKIFNSKKRLLIIQVFTLFCVIMPAKASANSQRCMDIFTRAKSENLLKAVKQNFDQLETHLGLPDEWDKNSIPELSSVDPSRPPFHEFRRIFNLKDDEPDFTKGVQYVLNPLPNRDISNAVFLPEVKSNFPHSEFLGEKWTWVDPIDPEKKPHHYRFVNFGTAQMRKDWFQLEKVVDEGVRMHPGQPLIVTFPPEYIFGHTLFRSWQKQSSQQVTDTYEKRKGYLSDENLHSLRLDDTWTPKNDDFLVLLKDPGISPLEMTAEQFEQNALVTVRLARMDQSSWLYPRRWSGGTDYLPMTQRLYDTSTTDKLDMGHFIQSKFNNLNNIAGKKVAEISRFVRFQDLPAPLMNNFLKNLFELAISPTHPIDLLMISVDSTTRKLFGSRYRFKDLTPLTDKDQSTQEYIMYLDTSSEDFAKTLTDLRLQAQSVTVVAEKFIPEKDRWVSPWKEQPRSIVGSPEEKRQQAIPLIQALRDRIKKERLKNTSWNINFLSDQRPPNLDRLKEIVNWVGSGERTPEVLRQRLNDLNSNDKLTIYKNAYLFSNDFQNLVVNVSYTFRTEGRLLIVRNFQDPLPELIRAQFGGRDVREVTEKELESLPSLNADAVVILESPGDLPRTNQQLEHLQHKMQGQLRPGGRMSGYGRYSATKRFWTTVHYSRGGPPTLIEILHKYAEGIFKNDSPISEKDLALDLAQRRLYYEMHGD